MGCSNREIRLVWCLWLSLPGSDGLFEQRKTLDMIFVAVPSGLRWAIRTEKSAWYGVCGCPYRAQTGNSNREIRLVWCLWLSLSPEDMSHGSGTRHWGQVPWFTHFVTLSYCLIQQFQQRTKQKNINEIKQMTDGKDKALSVRSGRRGRIHQPVVSCSPQKFLVRQQENMGSKPGSHSLAAAP